MFFWFVLMFLEQIPQFGWAGKRLRWAGIVTMEGSRRFKNLVLSMVLK